MWMLMQKIDYIYMITDNVLVYQISLPAELRGNQLQQHLDKYDEKFLKIIAGFDKNFLEHFLIISKGRNSEEFADILKKMEKISFMIGPTGNLNYLTTNQIQYILTKLGSLNWIFPLPLVEVFYSDRDVLRINPRKNYTFAPGSWC